MADVNTKLIRHPHTLSTGRSFASNLQQIPRVTSYFDTENCKSVGLTKLAAKCRVHNLLVN
jgi:hypothetical protein